LLLSFSLIFDKMYQTLNSLKVFKNILLHVFFFLEINLRTWSVKIMFQSGGLKGNVFIRKHFSHAVEWCCVVLESSGIFVNHSHMTLMIKWILMFLSARMATVMTGVFSNTQQKPTLLLSSQKNMIITLWAHYFHSPQELKTFQNSDSKAIGGLVVSMLDSKLSNLGSFAGWGHNVVFLDKTFDSDNASLHPGV